MAENEIILLHDRLYEYLKGLRDADPNFIFSTSQFNEFLKKKLWFYLNNTELETWLFNYEHGFSLQWHFLYNYKTRQWTCYFETKHKQSDTLKKIIDSSHFLGTNDNRIFKKVLNDKQDAIGTLMHFVQNEKKTIDDYFKPSIEFEMLPMYTKLELDFIIRFIEFVKLDTKQKYPKQLPFVLSHLEVIDFQGIKHLAIENIPSNTQWIFLTGENGFGKTSILRAIAKGLIGEEDFVEPLSNKSNRILIAGYNENQPFYCKRQKYATCEGDDLDFPMAAYGISRFRYHNDPEKNPPKTLALFSDEAPLINIERILVEAHRAKADGDEKGSITTFDKLKKILLSVIPQLSDIKVEYFKKEPITNRYQVRYYEKSTDDCIYEPIKRNDLAAGYRSILSIIGDMIVRLSVHTNHLLDDLQGIVLIDEFDAHLHPKYQYELPKLLSDAFPKVQFIVSTHSPIPILGVKPNTAVVLTVHRTKEAGITVERLDNDIEIHRLNPNALLTSPIFGFQQLFARDTTAEKIIPTDNYENVDFMKKMKARIQSLREQGLVK
jgi:predicted ATPase